MGQGVSQALFNNVYVIFPIHVNFRNRSRCVLKAIIHRKKLGLFYVTLESFFQKDAFDDVPVNVGPCLLLPCKLYMNSWANIEQKEPKFFGNVVPGQKAGYQTLKIATGFRAKTCFFRSGLILCK